MPVLEDEVGRLVEDLPEVQEIPEVPEVEIRGDEAVIRIRRGERLEERNVRLPDTTWG